MEAIEARPVLDRPLPYAGAARCRVREYDPQIIVVSDLPDSTPPVFDAILEVGRAVEQVLDVRLYQTNWRLVEHVPYGEQGALLLVTFSGYDRRTGALLAPSWVPAPPPLDWLRRSLLS